MTPSLRFSSALLFAVSATVSLPAVFAQTSAQTTWYVATTGNNSNACTSAGAPCSTLAGVQAKAIQPGDIIQVAAGTYAGVTITKSGTAGKKISWRGYNGSCPTVVNGDPNSRGVRPAPSVTLTSGIAVAASYVSVECFKVTSGGLTTSGSGRSNIDFLDNALVCATPGCRGFIVGEGASFVTMSRNYLNGTGPEQGTLIDGATNVTFSYNESERMRGNPGDNDHMRIWGDDLLIEGNYFHGNVYTDNPNGHSDGIQTFCLSGSCSVKRVTITRNVFFHADQHIIQSNTSSARDVNAMRDWTVTNNVFAFPRLNGSAIGGGGFGGAQNVLFYHNTLYQTSFNCGNDPVGSTVISRNNIFYQNSFTPQSGCVLTQSNNIQGSTNPQFVNLAGGDLHLQAGSPAIGGSYMVGITVDRDGRARDAQPDRGAYEQGSLTTTALPAAPLNVRIVR